MSSRLRQARAEGAAYAARTVSQTGSVEPGALLVDLAQMGSDDRNLLLCPVSVLASYPHLRPAPPAEVCSVPWLRSRPDLSTSIRSAEKVMRLRPATFRDVDGAIM
jgi:hypothetical protein